MANAAAPLRHWPRAAAGATATIRPHHFIFSCSGACAAAAAASSSSFLRAVHESHFSFLLSTPPTPRLRGHRPPQRRLFSSSIPLFARAVGLRTQGHRQPGPSEAENRFSQEESDSGSDPDSPKKSRNERKREARRAVKWGMDLANFSPPQIKQILPVASLEKEVFDAIMLVKRLGPDVREGRRRQFNYIGRLLRKVQPELMDTLIQALKDGDHNRVQALSAPETLAVEDYDEEEEETNYEEVSQKYVDIASRWFDGLVYKDSSITKEIYSIHNVEFDRQELRKLVRKVQTIEECHLVEGNGDVALTRAKQSLNHFLHTLAKRQIAHKTAGKKLIHKSLSCFLWQELIHHWSKFWLGSHSFSWKPTALNKVFHNVSMIPHWTKICLIVSLKIPQKEHLLGLRLIRMKKLKPISSGDSL